MPAGWLRERRVPHLLEEAMRARLRTAGQTCATRDIRFRPGAAGDVGFRRLGVGGERERLAINWIDVKKTVYQRPPPRGCWSGRSGTS